MKKNTRETSDAPPSLRERGQSRAILGCMTPNSTPKGPNRHIQLPKLPVSGPSRPTVVSPSLGQHSPPSDPTLHNSTHPGQQPHLLPIGHSLVLSKSSDMTPATLVSSYNLTHDQYPRSSLLRK
jgi:hypothetical protein